MKDRYKRLAVEEDKLDRLSDLPINVISQIQEYLDIEDAARMSTLSRNWRYIWASHPKLFMNEQFCRKRKQSGTTDVINSILSQHRGAVKTFSLDITLIRFSDHSILDKLMLFLSRNGIMDLTLKNRNVVNVPYKLPGCVYGMELLQNLYLSNCIFKPPCNFRLFYRLETILLNQVVFELDDNSTSNFLWLPSLAKLSLVRCGGLHHLNIYAPELVSFSLYFKGSGSFNLAPLLNCRKLVSFLFNPQEEVLENEQHDVISLTMLPSIWPKIKLFLFDKNSLKFLASGVVADRLITSFNNLEILYLEDFNVNDKEQMSSFLCLLRSCPNLKTLRFGSLDGMKRYSRIDDSPRLELPDCKIKELNNLETLHLRRFIGNLNQMMFVKFVLASTPLLRKIIVSFQKEVGQWCVRFNSMRLLRASPSKTRITYERVENYDPGYLPPVKD